MSGPLTVKNALEKKWGGAALNAIPASAKENGLSSSEATSSPSVGTRRSTRNASSSAAKGEALSGPLYARLSSTSHVAQQLTHLSMVPAQSTVLVYDNEFIKEEALKSDSPYDLLLATGRPAEQIYRNVVLTQFPQKLVLFPSSDEVQPILADWNGVAQFVERAFPNAAKAVHSHLASLKRLSLSDMSRQENIDFKASFDGYRSNPKFLSYDKFSKLSNPTLGQTRLFLYCELRLDETFDGSGKLNEYPIYLLENLPVANLPAGSLVVDLDVQMPSEELERHRGPVTIPNSKFWNTVDVLVLSAFTFFSVVAGGMAVYNEFKSYFGH